MRVDDAAGISDKPCPSARPVKSCETSTPNDAPGSVLPEAASPPPPPPPRRAAHELPTSSSLLSFRDGTEHLRGTNYQLGIQVPGMNPPLLKL